MNGNPFTNDSSFFALDSGMYHLVVTDDHGCSDLADVQVSFFFQLLKLIQSTSQMWCAIMLLMEL